MSFDPQFLEGIWRLFVALEGKDPEAQQTLNEFLKFDSNIERTNLPTRRDVHLVSYLEMVSEIYFPKNDNNPFKKLANCVSIAFMAKGGLKSNQFVDLMKQTPSLTDLQTMGESQQGGLMDKILGRRKEE